MAFSVHATSFLFDLRVVRRLLEHSMDSLYPSEDVQLAFQHLCKIIMRIEDSDALLKALGPSFGPPEEVGLEPTPLRSDAEQRLPD